MPHSDNINMVKKISEVYVGSSYSYNSHRFQTEKGSLVFSKHTIFREWYVAKAETIWFQCALKQFFLMILFQSNTYFQVKLKQILKYISDTWVETSCQIFPAIRILLAPEEKKNARSFIFSEISR